MEQQINLSLIKTALSMDAVSTQYRVELNHAEAIAFFDRQPGHFRMIPLIKGLTTLLPNHFHHRFLIGNEGSRVIYLDIRKNYYDVLDYENLVDQARLLAENACADEFEIKEHTDTRLILRLWWD